MGEPADFSGLYFAYQSRLIGDPAACVEATDHLLDELTTQGARLPGENSRRHRAECLRAGEVELDDSAIDLLAHLKRQNA